MESNEILEACLQLASVSAGINRVNADIVALLAEVAKAKEPPRKPPAREHGLALVKRVVNK
jgi:hypothetical protein